MNQSIISPYPNHYSEILIETQKAGFTMASDLLTCSLLRTLALSKPKGNFLELGTGTGLATAWILDGMDAKSSLISIDNQGDYLQIAQKYLGQDSRLRLIEADGGDWIQQNEQHKFDLIFADTWPGKYFFLEETLAMLNQGGFYIIDDMLPQANWPEDHPPKVAQLIADLENRSDLFLTKQVWASGIIIAVKK
jgi:predicted O-methyltransferase YrrM